MAGGAVRLSSFVTASGVLGSFEAQMTSHAVLANEHDAARNDCSLSASPRRAQSAGAAAPGLTLRGPATEHPARRLDRAVGGMCVRLLGLVPEATVRAERGARDVVVVKALTVGQRAVA